MKSSSPYDPGARRDRALTEFAARHRDAPRRARMDRAAAEAVQALARAGVEVLLLKGSALAQTLYAPDRERGYFDVDLLVAPDGRSTAGAVLAALGYRNATRDRGIDDVAAVLHAEIWSRLDESGNVTIDLHWRLSGCGAPPETVWTALRRGARQVAVGGAPVLTMNDSGLALHTALHLAQHGRSDAKAVSDLTLGLARWPLATWELAVALADELDALEAFTAGLRLIPEGRATSDTLRLSGGDTVLWDLEHRSARPRGTFHIDALTNAATPTQRLMILRMALLPSPNWIKWEMSWTQRGPAHLALGYLVHVARAPWWAARALIFMRGAWRQRRRSSP